MAYQLISGPTFESLPTHIIDFALNTLGWTSPAPGRLIIPGSDAGLSVAVDTYVTTSGNYRRRLRTQFLDGETVLKAAYCPNPYITQVYQEPVAMHLFGGSDPEPWLAAAIEYGSGFYRHMYIGRLTKIGNYTGGEVICGNTPYVWRSYDYRSLNHQYLFSGFQNAWSVDECGAVRLTHADLGGTLLADFRAASSEDSTSATANRVFGGFRDNINDQQVARGQNTFAGVQVFNPINLYLMRESSRVTPIGSPTGVRLVNITNIGPGTTVTVGNQTWRCFPQFKKGGTDISGPNSDPSNYVLDETSYVVGLAYLEG